MKFYKTFLSLIFFSLVAILPSKGNSQNLPSFLPTGTILMYPTANAPAGFLVLDGSCKKTVTYKALSAILKPVYGNTGCASDEFRLPDYRGRFVRSFDNTAGNDPDKASRTAMWSGAPSGNAVGSVQGHAFQTHNHGVTDPTHTHGANQGGYGTGIGGPLGQGPGGSTFYMSPAATGITIQNAESSGSNSQPTANENRPVNVTALYIIKI